MNGQAVWHNLGYLSQAIGKVDKGIYGIQGVIAVLTVISRLLYVWFPKWILDCLSEKSYNQVIVLVIILCLCILGFSSMLSLLETINAIRQERLKLYFDEKLARKAFSLCYEAFEEYQTRQQYEFAIKCVREDRIKKLFQNMLTLVEAIITIGGLLYIVQYIPWFLWSLLLVGAAIQCICAVVRMRYNFQSYQNQNEVDMGMLYARGRLTGKSFAKEVRLFGMYGFVTRTAQHYIHQLATIQKERAKNNFQTLWWSFLLASLETLGVYGFVAYQCYKGAISIGEFSMIVSAMLLFIAMINQIGQILMQMGEQSQYIQSMRSFLEKEEHMQSRESRDPEIKSIAFENVSFAYPGSDFYAIQQLTLCLEAGKKYGIVGLNGSGKTTFISLLMGLYRSYSGKISINGQSIKSVNPKDLQAYFSPVMQNFGTYAYTIGENIALSETVDVERIMELLEKVELLDKIGSFKKGINTYLTEAYNDSGTELSIGEQQKLAMARALYKDAPIVVLDEPTAALSPKSEYNFYKIFNELMKDKTVFYISHRLASCRMCDEIIVFNQGQMVEKGSHEALMNQNGVYAHLFQVQAEQFEVDKHDE